GGGARTNGIWVVTPTGPAGVVLAGSTATVTWTGAISSAVAQSIVDGLTYQDSSQNPTAGARVVTLTSIQDSGGTSNGGIDTTNLNLASTVTVVPVNNPPGLGSVAGSAPLTENSAAGALPL